MLPSDKAVQAAVDSLPCNDILYGDTSKPVSLEEMRKAIEAAYEVDFEAPRREYEQAQARRRALMVGCRD